MKKLFTLLALTISFSMNAQMDDNSHPSNNSAGTYSVAMGYGTTASGDFSTAMGGSTTASGELSTAMGRDNIASGYASTAMGYQSRASDFGLVAIGQYNSSGSSVTNNAISFSTSNTAFVIGNGTVGARSDAFKVMFNGDAYISSSLYLGGTAITATAAEINLLDGVVGILSSVTENSNTGVRLSTSNASNHGDIGSNAVDLSYSSSSSSSYGATGNRSTAMGDSTTASGYAATAMGEETTASGTRSTAMGFYTTASDFASLVIGQYNSSGSSVTNSASSFSTSNTAFVIGNGTFGSLSDAFKVMFNGDATVSNDLTVSGDVNISSDARLKSNIVSLGSTLTKLLQIDGKSYEMKGKQKIGVLAQEIQEVFPELVSEDDNEMLAVNYQGLVPVLINALKEQDKIIKTQEERLSKIEEVLASLNE